MKVNYNNKPRNEIKLFDGNIFKELEELFKEEELFAKKEEDHIKEVTSMELPLDWSNAFCTDERTQGIHADSVSDGLILSLANLGCVDIEYISAITGEDYKTVINTLKGSIYQNPDTWNECFYKGWETADEYLSGNLFKKWQNAYEANAKYKGYFTDNITAIQKVIPKPISAKDIYITLGSPWVPTKVIDDFIIHLFGDPLKYCYAASQKEYMMRKYKTKHDDITGSWEIPEKSRYGHTVLITKTYGTPKLEALHILERTLNMKTVTVSDEIPCLTNKSGVKKVINQSETLAAIEKQKLLIEEFQKWVWTDPKRKSELEDIYSMKYGSNRRRIFDGSFLTFPGLSPTVTLPDYQKNAVARIIFTPNTLLAHDVGAGKTYVMIAAGQELKRMGLSKKNMYVVPNNITGQWKNIFKEMYPSAKVLCIEPKAFTPDKRSNVLKDIRDNDYDGIIIAYSCFEQIALSKKFYIQETEDEYNRIQQALKNKNKKTYRLEKRAEELRKSLLNVQSSITTGAGFICFDELGITRLFVDEAHNFKNVKLDTKTNMVLGLSSSGSKKCQDMMDKVHHIQKQNDGKGVVMATGTPITNSITDAYIMQKYLQSGELAMLDLDSFDSWIGMFAERASSFEIDVDTNSYRLATRFSKFHNLTELTSLLASIADFHQLDDSSLIPKCDGRIDTLVPKSVELADYLTEISQRADEVRKGAVKRNDDNMLKITTDGRKAALDIRLVNENASFSYKSKVAQCVQNVTDIYYKTFENKNTQIIFCDTSTPKAGFNIYDELKSLLMQQGIPSSKIAYIHDANTETQRQTLFAQVRKGDIRILIGSTFKLGLGVNVQDRLIALHHIDVPWRPADMVQREGRILRQGNTCDKVYIYRYVTEGSFDAYSWQLLETKQHFITELLSGSLTERSGSDIEDTVLDYAEVKALAIGNPLIKKRVETANELTRLRTLQSKAIENKMTLKQELLELPNLIKGQEEKIADCKEDCTYYKDWKKAHPPIEDEKLKLLEREQRKNLREYISNAVKAHILQPDDKKLMAYRGFDIVLPSNMIQEKPYVWFVRKGKYYVELGDTEKGNLIRLDNFLDSLDRYLIELENGLGRLKEKEQDIKRELAKNENYYDEIEKLKQKLDDLDKELGVKKK